MPTRTIDNGFLFFRPTLKDVFERLDDPQIQDRGLSKRFVAIHTGDTTRVITNSDFPLGFGQAYRVEIVDSCDKVLDNVTDRAYMYQSINPQTGVLNQYIELIQLPKAYSCQVHIKITHFSGTTRMSNLAAYSNPINIVSDVEGTSLLTYWDVGLRFGYDFSPINGTPKICQIRVRGSFRQLRPETPDETYTQVSAVDGNGIMIMKHSDDVLIARAFISEYCDNHGAKAFEYFRKMGVKYINNIRVTSLTQEIGDVLGSTNFFTANWKAYTIESEYYVDSFQIARPFALTAFSPSGLYTLTSFPSTMTGTFNYPITLGVGNVTVYDENGSIFAIFPSTAITVAGNSFSINISGETWVNGNYYVNFPAGLFIGALGQTVAVTGDEAWTFSISDGDWLDGDWDSSDWFTN